MSANRTNSGSQHDILSELADAAFRLSYWQPDHLPVKRLLSQAKAKIEALEVDLADSQSNALSEAQGGEWAQEEVIRLRKALMEIRRYPKGWENRGSITDFIDEVVPLDARPD